MPGFFMKCVDKSTSLENGGVNFGFLPSLRRVKPMCPYSSECCSNLEVVVFIRKSPFLPSASCRSQMVVAKNHNYQLRVQTVEYTEEWR